MSTKRSLSLMSLIAVLLLAVTACDIGGAPAAGTPSSGSGAGAGAGAGVATPTTAALALPTNLPLPAQTAVAAIPTIAAAVTPAGAGGGETRAVKKLSTGLEKLKSYRAQFAIAFDGVDKNKNP